MVVPVDRARWRAAQRGQEAAQRRKRDGLVGREAALVAGSLLRSVAMRDRLLPYGARTDGVVVEVGAGAHGLIWGWPHGRRVAVDPLAAFFRREFAFLQAGRGTFIVEARGEELPLPTASVDLLLSDNVLDHLEDPAAFLAELVRVLVPGGVLFLSADTHHLVWSLGARLYNAVGRRSGRYLPLPAFPNHPFHFTEDELAALLAASGLVLLAREVEAPAPVGWQARRPYDVLKRVFFKNRRVEVVARKAG